MSDGGGNPTLNHVRSFFRGTTFPGAVKVASADQGQASVQRSTPTAQASSSGAQTPSAELQQLHIGAPASPAGTPATSPSAQDDRQLGTAKPGEPDPSSPFNAGGSASTKGKSTLRSMSDTRIKKFDKLLADQVVDLDLLRELAWSGIPADLRPTCWQLLLGYAPPNRERREQILARKRQEYRDMVPEYYDVAMSSRSEDEVGALRQVAVDVPRTAPGVAFFHEPAVQKCLERILYIWGVRHPASGYVQGINDLVTPFLAVFLSQHFDGPMEEWRMEQLPEECLLGVEADAYWCLSKLVDSIQDHYINGQPGIQRTVFHLKELVRRIDQSVAQHMEDEGLELLQFAFRWVNCLMIREIPFHLGMRLWDTYLAEGPRMKDFLMYVCAAFLLTWQQELHHMDFQEMMLFLQKPPTQAWDEKEIELILSQAYMWTASFGEAQSHLQSS